MSATGSGSKEQVEDNNGVPTIRVHGFQKCHDTQECAELYPEIGLYIKPMARLSITVQLPMLKYAGSAICNWDVIEKLRSMIKPIDFTSIKTVKTCSEFLRFECDLMNRNQINTILDSLNNKTMKLPGFEDLLQIKAAEAKMLGPAKRDWETFFRDRTDYNESEFGERPDTIYIRDLPIKWFVDKNAIGERRGKPSEFLIRQVFETYGKIRQIDVPMNDAARASSIGYKTGNMNCDISFEMFVQYCEYPAFAEAMQELRGKLIVQVTDDGGAFETPVNVDFDKTKHMTAKAVRRRRLETEKAQLLSRAREMKEEEDQLRQITDKEKRRREREQKRKDLLLQKSKRKEEDAMQMRIKLEERKIIIAQRKLESIRLMTFLFERLKSEMSPVTNIERTVLNKKAIASAKVTVSDSKSAKRKVEVIKSPPASPVSRKVELAEVKGRRSVSVSSSSSGGSSSSSSSSGSSSRSATPDLSDSKAAKRKKNDKRKQKSSQSKSKRRRTRSSSGSSRSPSPRKKRSTKNHRNVEKADASLVRIDREVPQNLPKTHRRQPQPSDELPDHDPANPENFKLSSLMKGGGNMLGDNRDLCIGSRMHHNNQNPRIVGVLAKATYEKAQGFDGRLPGNNQHFGRPNNRNHVPQDDVPPPELIKQLAYEKLQRMATEGVDGGRRRSRSPDQRRREFDHRSFHGWRMGGMGDNRVCFNCNERGHVSSHCPKGNHPRVCYTCNERGHVSSHCPKNYNNRSRNHGRTVSDRGGYRGGPPRAGSGLGSFRPNDDQMNSGRRRDRSRSPRNRSSHGSGGSSSKKPRHRSPMSPESPRPAKFDFSDHTSTNAFAYDKAKESAKRKAYIEANKDTLHSSD